MCSPANAQGIEAEIPQALPPVKPRNWSGKPGPARAPDAPKRKSTFGLINIYKKEGNTIKKKNTYEKEGNNHRKKNTYEKEEFLCKGAAAYSAWHCLKVCRLLKKRFDRIVKKWQGK
jgi:hypothetical protein